MKQTITKRNVLLLAMFLGVIVLQAQPIDMNLFSTMKARNIGPAGMSGRVTSIDVVNKQASIIYVGTASGGLWKSNNEGITWAPIFDSIPVASIGAVSIDQSNPDVVWAGTGEGNPRNSQNSGYGIYKSNDAGLTWQLMGLEKTRTIHRIAIDPRNSDVVYVGDTKERGVYKTTDGGKTWKQILFTNERSGVADMVMDPENPNKLFVAMWEYRRWPWFFKSGGDSDIGMVCLELLQFRADEVLVHHRVQVGDLGDHHPSSGKGQQVLNDGGRLLPRLLHDEQRLSQWAVRRHIQQQAWQFQSPEPTIVHRIANPNPVVSTQRAVINSIGFVQALLRQR